MSKRLFGPISVLVLAATFAGTIFAHQKTALMMEPVGIYVMTNSGYRDGGFSDPYVPGLQDAAGYANVDGHALFVPLARVLPVAPADWSSWAWDWTYLDSLIAGTNGKPFSLSFQVGFGGAPLPAGWDAACPGCSASFHTWTLAGGCLDMSVLLPWEPKVQAFWAALAEASAAHLVSTGAYGQLRLVHVSGLSIYDEELRLPTAALPGPEDAGCTVAEDTTEARYTSLGYVDPKQVRHAFKVLVAGWASAYPDKFLGLSLFPPKVDFPKFMDKDGGLTWSLAEIAADAASGRLLIQADMAGSPNFQDAGYVLPEAEDMAGALGARLGWQTQGPGIEFADSSAGYAELLHDMSNAQYIEVYSHDVVAYPDALLNAPW